MVKLDGSNIQMASILHEEEEEEEEDDDESRYDPYEIHELCDKISFSLMLTVQAQSS